MDTNGFVGRSGARFYKATADGADPKLDPIGNSVLILVDKAAETTMGGLILTDDMAERETLGSETGAVIEVGPDAFPRLKGETRPKRGDRVIFERYAGTHVRGFDGYMYRVMSSECVIARIAFDQPEEPDAARTEEAA